MERSENSGSRQIFISGNIFDSGVLNKFRQDLKQEDINIEVNTTQAVAEMTIGLKMIKSCIP